MTMAITLCVLGLAVLVVGAELVVRGGGSLATRLQIPPIVIGLTIVAVGTSAPELAVGIEAARRGEGALAVGNIAGTNSVNILLILGLSAVMEPLRLGLRTLRIELPVMIAAAFALMAMAWDGVLTRGEGVILVASGLVYTALVIRLTRRESRAVRREFAEEFERWRIDGSALRSIALNLIALLAGIATVVIGADWLVDGAVDLAELLGVSDAFIGLTIVAIGTSSPELATTIVSTIRRNRDIAVGNLIGSSVYNILIILGLTCIVPAEGVPVSPELVRIDIPVMTAAAIACVPVFLSGRRVSRREGALFVSAYLVYLLFLIATRT